MYAGWDTPLPGRIRRLRINAGEFEKCLIGGGGHSLAESGNGQFLQGGKTENVEFLKRKSEFSACSGSGI